ncbi:hypothetical protein H0H93_008649, partial [Arthromyces matolae]
MNTVLDEAKYNGVLPSKADGKANNMEHGQEILRIAGEFIRALDYKQPPFPRDPVLHQAIVDEINSWNIGEAADGFMGCVDVGLAAAELFYPSHEFDLKIIMAICTAGMKWMDNVADDILDALTEFQGRFHAGKPQLHPVLDCYATYMLRLYDHYEPFVADAMVMSSVTFMHGSCIEVRALAKNMGQSTDAVLWPYHVRALSGKAASSCTQSINASLDSIHTPASQRKITPTLSTISKQYPKSLSSPTSSTMFLGKSIPLRYNSSFNPYNNFSFYKEEMDGELHNYCQAMSRVNGEPAIKVLQDVSDETVAVAKRAALILKDQPEARRAFKEYEQGY